MSKQVQDTGQQLFDEFPPVSREEWEKVIEQDLNGADYREKLKWDTKEGIEALPFYRRDDLEDLQFTGPVPAGKKQKNAWRICQPVFDQRVDDANNTAREAVDQGADLLLFEFHVRRTEGALGGDLRGTDIQRQDDFSRLLKGIDLEETGLSFDSGMATPVLLAMLHNELKNRPVERNAVTARFLYDPYTYMAVKGQMPKPEESFLDDAARMVSFCRDNLPSVQCLGVDARTWHNAGCTITQELALALSTGSEYLAKLSERNIGLDQITANIHFSYGIGSNYFLEIAKFRAARLLWQQIVEAYDPEIEQVISAHINGETSRRNKTIYDPCTNMLRTTTEGMSAAIAGCDSVTVHPYDISFQQPDAFSQRIARNTQHIFREESYLDQVHDPAAGSYYIETLTDKIAREAWKQFQEIEKQGGISKAIRHGSVATMIEKSKRERDEAIATRGRIFVGTNQYPNNEERASDNVVSAGKTVSLKESGNDMEIERSRLLDSLAEIFDLGGMLGDVVPGLYDHGKQLFRAVEPYRAARPFEELRLATEHHSRTPTVLMLPIGNRTMCKARSTFASNFFGCAGYDIADPIGFENVENAVEAVKQHQPDIAVLCSSDQEYEELVEPICTALDHLKNKPIAVLAGYPEEHIDSYRKAGIEFFIHRNSNVLETLKAFHQKLGMLERR
ncbi:MAG: methylmalonyl-CoA mutase family protein [Balneolaceae bacterium]|nr:methylmalonyl-CoA mutase family protein [Balneolaceae bacterium]